MNNSNKWVFTYALSLIDAAKLSLFACAFSSLVYAYGLYIIGDRVLVGEFDHITVISLGAGAVLLLKFLTQLFADFSSIKLSGFAQMGAIKGVEDRFLLLKSTLNDSQLLHRLSVDFTHFSDSLIQGIVQTVTQATIVIFVSGYLVLQYQRELPQIILFLSLGISLSLSLHFILKVLTSKKAEIDADIFRFKKNIITGLDHLITSDMFSSWTAKYGEKLVQQMHQDKKISLLQHGSSTLNWGARYVFILIIISPMMAETNLSPASIYWLYILLGLSTQLFWTLFHFGQARVYAERAQIIVDKCDVKNRLQHHNVLRVEGKDLSIFFGPTQKTIGIKTLNFCWEINDKVWVEGSSGTGKTTLLRSILGLHNNFEGSLLVPGKPFRVGYLSQDPFFFDGESLSDNLNFYKLTDNFKEIVNNLKLTSFFENINWDLDRLLGTEGVSPSRGQRLRLGLLRELLQKPNLLLLDEPSANLDSDTAKQILVYLGGSSFKSISVICEHKCDLKHLFAPTQTLSI